MVSVLVGFVPAPLAFCACTVIADEHDPAVTETAVLVNASFDAVAVKFAVTVADLLLLDLITQTFGEGFESQLVGVEPDVKFHEENA